MKKKVRKKKKVSKKDLQQKVQALEEALIISKAQNAYLYRKLRKFK